MSTGPSFDLDFVATFTDGSVWRRGPGASRGPFHGGVAIDGRAVRPGGIWFAIHGEHHDGHNFAAQAVHSGAACLVVSRGRAAELDRSLDVSIIEVDDTTAALGRLGRAHRERLTGLTVVGVTGSNGKTTTKELIAGILSAHAGHAAVHKTEGNFNNHLGLPLTLLQLHEDHRYAVIEMGMSALGEIAYLASLARPRVGVIVNVGPVHLETLGSIENVARAKGELFAALPPTGCAVYPDGDALLAAQADASRAARRIRFGDAPGVPVRVVSALVEPDATAVRLRLPDGEHVSARLAAVGEHNARNAAAAAAACVALGVPAADIAAGLARATVARHRSQVIDVGGRRVLDDCYNASPLSTVAALDTLVRLKRGRRAVAVLGDMLELGPDAPMLHRNMGEHAARRGVDVLIACGPHAQHVVAAARAAGLPADRAYELRDVESIPTAVLEATEPGDWVLVKASRGMRLERVIDGMKEHVIDVQERGAG